MKVFWAWQADLPGKISRHFVRGALEEAVARLRQPKDIEEPPEEARRNDLHLDHDTKGLSGSPEIAHEIFRKIDASAVFVADMTPVGKGPNRKDKDGNEVVPKPLMNPNVAIELGYALRTRGSERLLMILNEAYGGVSGLPFDIQHRRRPIIYRLAEGSDNAEIATEKGRLVEKLIEALAPFLAQAEAVPAEVFAETPAKIGRGLFFEEGEPLGLYPGEDENYVMPFRSIMYLRVIPRRPLERPLALDLLRKNIGRFSNFAVVTGGVILENDYGVALLSPAGATSNLDSLSQYFRNGEIWGVNAEILREGDRGTVKWVSSLSLEEVFTNTLRQYVEFTQQVSKVALPLKIIAGIEGVKERKLLHDGMPLGQAGVMYEDNVTHEAVLNDVSVATQAEFLMKFFEKVNDNGGVPRPRGLYGR
jgi:hypothetical protein